MNEKQNDLGDNQSMIAFIACSGNAANKSYLKDGCDTCSKAVEAGFKRGECKNGCVGIGSCVKVCKQGALKNENGKIILDKEKCNGCGDCTKDDVCPQHLIRLIPQDATNFIPCSSKEEDEETVRKTCGFGCIACGECERVCPRGAISIVDNHAVIDYDKCVGCSACTVKCKKKIIVDTLHSLTTLKDKVAFVRCNGGKRSNEIYKEAGIQTCEQAVKLDAKSLNVCTTGCCGFGSCVEVCRYDAISIVDGTALVDSSKCVGCRDCTYACPRGLITIVPYKGTKLVPCSSIADYKDKSRVCDSGCIACEDCLNNCPNEAIYMEDKHAVIDASLCEDCNMCQYVCSCNVIKTQVVPEHINKQYEVMKLEQGGI